MTTSLEDTNETAVAFTLGTPPDNPNSAVNEALQRFARTLSAMASRSVTVETIAAGRCHPKALNDTNTVWFGTEAGTAVGIKEPGGYILAELLLGMTPQVDNRHLSPVETKVLCADLLPTLHDVSNELTTAPANPLTELKGAAVVQALSVNSVLNTLHLAVTAPNGSGGTVTCELVIVAPGSVRPAGPGARLEDLSGNVGDVPLPVRVTLPPTRVSAHELAQLAPGSFLELSATADTPWLVWASDELVAHGCIGRANNRRSVQIEMTWRQNPMSEQILNGLAAATDAVSGAAGEPEPEGLGRLGNVTVEVSAELGRVTVPLRDIASLHAGQVIELDKAPDSPFTVVANGVALATAELVIVDGRVGLRVVGMIKN